MLEIGDKMYYIDLKVIDDLVDNDESLKAQEIEETEVREIFDKDGNADGKEVISKKYSKGKEIDASKYSTIMLFIDSVMAYNEEIDDTLGFDRGMNKAPISFKVAFNTLLFYKILKEI